MTLEACGSGRGAPLDSFLHVGSSAPTLLQDGDRLAALLARFNFEEAARRLSESLPAGELEMSSIRGRPVVPGSSVKGNVRSRLELSFRAVNGRVLSCFSKASPPHMARDERAKRHRAVWGAALDEDRGRPCDHTRGNPVCLLCDLFGAPGLASLIQFSDCFGEGVRLEPLKAGRGLTLKAAPPGSEFKGAVWFQSLRPEELGLLLMGMGVKDSGETRPVLFGRLKYQGKLGVHFIGRARYRVSALSLSPHSERLPGLDPGQTCTGEALSRLLQALTSESRKQYGREMKEVDEVRTVEL